VKFETLTAPSPGSGSAATNSSEPPIPIRLRRILVADDDEVILNLITSVLAEAGFEVDGVPDGQEAWEALLSQSYDLLVTDNEMPRLAGLELIERIRHTGKRLPIIVASGNLSEEGARDYPQLEITAVIAKPFSILAFLDLVKEAFQTSCGESVARAGASHPPHPGLQAVH
jgi:two-component system, OmpR family, response regulator QseB